MKTRLTTYADRAQEAPLVRRMFSSSPNDPRYHMLSHISTKFKRDVKAEMHEPRAALFLNRFTRTLTIMYATSGIHDIIGIPAGAMRGRSFYHCIAENCLPDAVKCLENAKGNDSIAYLRFWFRDPRMDDEPPPPDEDSDEEMTTTDMSEDLSVEGGVYLEDENTSPHRAESSTSNSAAPGTHGMEIDSGVENPPNHRMSSGESTNAADTHEGIFGQPQEVPSSTSSLAPSSEHNPTSPLQAVDPLELEAVISCTSDGLVVCLRKARPMIPHPTHHPSRPAYPNGIFAAPWAQEPIFPPVEVRPGAGFGTAFAPALGPRAVQHDHVVPHAHTGPAHQDFLHAIREQAVFAWALTGINGTLVDYAQGKPVGNALPQDGVPIWASDPRHNAQSESVGNNGDSNGWHHAEGGTIVGAQDAMSHAQLFGDPGLDRSGGNTSSGSASGSGQETPFSG